MQNRERETLEFSSVPPWYCPLGLCLLTRSFVFCTLYFVGCTSSRKLFVPASSLLRKVPRWSSLLTSERACDIKKHMWDAKRHKWQPVYSDSGEWPWERTFVLSRISSSPLRRGQREFWLYIHLRIDCSQSGDSPRRSCGLLRLLSSEKWYLFAHPSSSSISHVSSVPK